MPALTRRTFVTRGACSLVALAALPRFLIRAVQGGEPGRRKVLVAVFQRGAVDGLSMVVPHGDPGYYEARSSIALARPRRSPSDTLLDLDGFFALHPSLASLQEAWNARALAIVQACGSPGHHPIALRRPGLHGSRHPRDQEHAGRVAEPGAPRVIGLSVTGA